MTPHDLIAAFDVIAEAPDGVKRLRELVLQLAVRGKLVPQDGADETKPVDGRSPRAASQLDPASVAFAIPHSWHWSTVDGCCSYVRRGKSPTYDDGGSVAVVSQKCVQWSGFDISRVRFVSDGSTRRYEEAQFLREGDLLWNSTGQGTLGRIIPFRPSDAHGRVVADSHVTILRPSACTSRFLWIWLAGPLIQARIDSLASGSTKQTELATKTIAALPVPVPPLAEQHRIVKRVDELMSRLDRLEAARKARDEVRRAARDAALAALRDAPDPDAVEAAWSRITLQMTEFLNGAEDVRPLRQTILQLAAKGRLVPQNSSDPSVQDFLLQLSDARDAKFGPSRRGRKVDNGRIESARPDWLPASWAWVPFGETHINRDGERVPVAAEEREGRRGQYDYYGASGVIDAIHAYLFDKPLLLVGEDGANLILRSTPIAFIAYGKYWVNNHAHVLDSIDDGSLRFLAVFLNATDLRPYLTGTAQPKLNQAKMNSIPCALPPLAEQHRIVAKVDELMALCDALEARLTTARDLHAQLAAAAVHHLDVA